MIKYIKIIIVITFVLGIGYSIFLNIKLNDYMRIQGFIQINFPDETIPALKGYEKFSSNIKKEISFYNLTICRLKNDLEYLSYDYNQEIDELLILKTSKNRLSNILKYRKESLSDYLSDKEYIDCDALAIKIDNNTKK